MDEPDDWHDAEIEEDRDYWVNHLASMDEAEIDPPKRAPDVADTEPEEERSSWWPTTNPNDTGELTPPEPPSIVCRADGLGLFYPGTVNGIHGESGDGKSWLMQAGAAQELQAQRHVWYLDFESRYDEVTQRLLDLGANWDAIRPFWHYSSPHEPLVVKDKWTRGGIDLVEGLERFNPSFCVVDGITEAMDIHGLNPLDNADFAKFRRLLLTRIADHGPACATVDHVNKNPDTRNGQAMGAQHKRAGMTGAAYDIRTVRRFARGEDGELKIVCAKDRQGFWAKGKAVAHAIVTSAPSGAIRIDFVSPTESVNEEGDFRPTGLMEKVSRYLELEPDGASTRQIRKDVAGRNEYLDKAIKALVTEGYIDPNSHRVITPFRDTAGMDEAA